LTQVNNIVGLITNLKLIRALEVINNETHTCELGIFTRCAIECEGFEGTVKSPEGSINFASKFATGENFVGRKVKRGVKYLRDNLSRGMGMHGLHTISLYASLGHSTFTVMIKSEFEQDLGDDSMDDYLVRVKHRVKNARHNLKHETSVNLKELGDNLTIQYPAMQYVGAGSSHILDWQSAHQPAIPSSDSEGNRPLKNSKKYESKLIIPRNVY
jgi:hypothetical protein